MAATGKSKQMTSSAPEFAAGGKTPMFGQQHADTQQSGQTGHTVTPSGSRIFATGGDGHMVSQQHANPKVPGRTGKVP